MSIDTQGDFFADTLAILIDKRSIDLRLKYDLDKRDLDRVYEIDIDTVANKFIDEAIVEYLDMN